MSLSDTKIRSLRPSSRPFKAPGSRGLYLPVSPGGSRHWYLKYRVLMAKNPGLVWAHIPLYLYPLGVSSVKLSTCAEDGNQISRALGDFLQSVRRVMD